MHPFYKGLLVMYSMTDPEKDLSDCTGAWSLSFCLPSHPKKLTWFGMFLQLQNTEHLRELQPLQEFF